MPGPQFHIAIKNNVTADSGDGVLDLHFLDRIQDREYFDWNSMSIATSSLLAEIVEQVNYYKPKKIVQHVDSWGGDADLGKGIYNFLKSYSAKVETKILNKAASAATVICCAGNKITMPSTGMYVIHQAQNSAQGTSKELREAADVADLYTDTYCQIYASNNRKGKTKEQIMALIADGDYWMTGEQAKEMGFVDECYNDEAVTVTANIESAKAQYPSGILPKSLQNITASLDEPKEENENSILTQFNTVMKNFGEMVTALLGGKKITAKVNADGTIDVTAAIQPSLAELADNMQTAVTAEFEEMESKVTASVVKAVNDEYKTVIADQTKTIGELKTTIETLTADVIALAGGESKPGKKEVNADGKSKRPHLGSNVTE